LKLPLGGINVLDLSRNIAGSYAALLLSEQGADCVKLEPRSNGKQHRSVEFAVFNRSKRSLALNLTDPMGKAAFARLLHKIDVVITDFSPGEAKSLSVDYRRLRQINPRLINLLVTPLGENGPLRNKSANDGVVEAFAGTMRSQGGVHFPPVFVFLPLPGYAAAMLGAYGVAAALLVRELTGEGQKVDTSLLAGAITMESGAFIAAPAIAPLVAKTGIQQGILPGYRLYRCKDSRWIMLACGNATFWNKCCLALQRVDLISDPRFEGMPWGIKSLEHRKALTNILADIFVKRESAHWLSLFAAEDVPCALVQTRVEFMNDPQVLHNGMLIMVDDYHFGKMRQVGIPIKLQGYNYRIKSPAPRCGQHSREILREFGFAEREITGLKKKGLI